MDNCNARKAVLLMALPDNEKGYNMDTIMHGGLGGKEAVAGLDCPPQGLILTSPWLSGSGS
ncbi:MAG: hypothetical protein RIF36_07720 [Imperialibacter sp.]|uniref:hypothetical protein n=1 Tax=Imperialibacter sp. TaxID=2038411 RepID=UPI0032EF063F